MCHSTEGDPGDVSSLRYNSKQEEIGHTVIGTLGATWEMCADAKVPHRSTKKGEMAPNLNHQQKTKASQSGRGYIGNLLAFLSVSNHLNVAAYNLAILIKKCLYESCMNRKVSFQFLPSWCYYYCLVKLNYYYYINWYAQNMFKFTKNMY